MSTIETPPRTMRPRRLLVPVAVLIVALVALVVLVAIVVGPRVYNAFSLLNSGEQVDIGGRDMFVLCRGSGAPTVLLEHGLGSNGTEWQAVQDKLAATGFSDPPTGDRVRTEVSGLFGTENPERIDFEASAEQARATNHLGAMPLVVLQADQLQPTPQTASPKKQQTRSTP